MMDQLGIKTLQPGADGMHPNAPNAANYDEAKAGSYSLPDPLTLNNGQKVTDATMWWTERRPQLLAFFNQDIYGRVPDNVPHANWKIAEKVRENVGGVDVWTKHLLGEVDNASDPAVPVTIHLSLTTPVSAHGSVPVIMEFAFTGPFARMIPKPPGPSWQQQVLEKGWGYAIYEPYSVQADNGAGLREGIIGLANKGAPRSPDEWGALRAWAWGASRALDYFESDRAVSANQVGVMGHSRFGKAALVAMAYDQRFAIGYISSSGEAGAKLYRRNFGETVGNIAGSGEYHWMAGNFLKYAGPLSVQDMPVDAHDLFALCAPRPVFVGAGAIKGDGWTDPKGMFLAEAAASPVYRLLGKPGLGTDEFPPIGTAIVSGNLGFREHTEGHTPAPNWPVFLDFAARFLR